MKRRSTAGRVLWKYDATRDGRSPAAQLNETSLGVSSLWQHSAHVMGGTKAVDFGEAGGDFEECRGLRAFLNVAEGAGAAFAVPLDGEGELVVDPDVTKFAVGGFAFVFDRAAAVEGRGADFLAFALREKYELQPDIAGVLRVSDAEEGIAALQSCARRAFHESLFISDDNASDARIHIEDGGCSAGRGNRLDADSGSADENLSVLHAAAPGILHVSRKIVLSVESEGNGNKCRESEKTREIWIHCAPKHLTVKSSKRLEFNAIRSYSGGVLESEGDAHAAADAERGNAALSFAFQHFMKQSDRDASAGASDGMAEGDGASVNVELVAVEMKFAIARQNLSGEGLIQFD